ncbi:MAG: hypothetical protein NTW19_16395 [Planctomycetota bacterium]|nr:hypothetical protein [Planctomycetota bacterium]
MAEIVAEFVGAEPACPRAGKPSDAKANIATASPINTLRSAQRLM